MRFSFIVLAVAVLFSAGSIQAQKCKLDVDENDAFSGKVKKVTKDFAFIPNDFSRDFMSGWAIITREGDEVTLQMELLFKNEMNRAIKPTDKFILKLSNGDLIELSANSPTTPETFVGATGIETKFKVKYDINAAVRKTLSEQLVTHTKLVVGEAEHTVEIKEKRSERFKQLFICVLD